MSAVGLQLLDSTFKHRGKIPPICRWSDAPVTLWTGPTAAPGPASQILPELALTVNQTKTKIMIFQKKPRCQENKYMFTLGSTVLEHTMKYTYLGLDVTASGSFSMAVNALKEKSVVRVLDHYAIQSKCYNINIPISIWCKFFDSIIQPITLYGSKVWGPLSAHD